MAAYKHYSIAIALLLIQALICQSLPTKADESKTEAYALAKAKFQAFTREYSEKSIEIIRELLKDEKLLSNNETKVKNFLNNLAEATKAYDGIEIIDQYAEFLRHFILMAEHYMNLPEDKVTANTKYIEDLLSKYGLKSMSVEVEKEFKAFWEIENSFRQQQQQIYSN